jgi:hypothetical protein
MQMAMEEDQEVQLPEDLLSSKEEVALSVEGEEVGAEKGKKQKTWGPVMATRQSNRIDRSMKIMDNAKELKKKTNLEMPASKKLSGIMRSNPFNLLQFDSLGDMASTVGVKIGSSILSSSLEDSEVVEIPTSIDLSCLKDNKISYGRNADIVELECDQISIDSMESPEQYNTALDSFDLEEGAWTKVGSKKWGKHPRKSFKC